MIEDTDARIQGALVLLLVCGAYACAVQYSLVADAIILSDRGPTKTARLLKLSQSWDNNGRLAPNSDAVNPPLLLSW